MDANGTKFSLIQGQADWARCRGVTSAGSLSDPGDFTEDCGLSFDRRRSELTLFPQMFLFMASQTDPVLQLEQRRGAARDRFANWYWISSDRTKVSVWTEGAVGPTDFWPVGPPPACAPPAGAFQPAQAPQPVTLKFAGLAVTEDHYLVVGVSGPPGQEGYLVFDLAGGGGPRKYLWPATVKFSPFDMAARVGGGVWILDRDNRRFWELDRRLDIVKREPNAPSSSPSLTGFVSAGPQEPRKACDCIPVVSVTDADAVSLPDDVCAIESLARDRVLLLRRPTNNGMSEISLYQSGELCGKSASLESIREHLSASQRATFSLVAHDFAFVQNPSSNSGLPLGRLYFASNSGNQSFAFDVFVNEAQLDLQAVAAYFPMRSFGGKGLVAAAGKAYYDFADIWVPLVDQQRPSYPEEATVETRIFDGSQPQCIWHRLLLDGSLPNETQVEVWTRTADELNPALTEEDRRAAIVSGRGADELSPSSDPLSGAPWFTQPALLRRSDGSEQPFLPAPSNSERGTFELLFQQAQGRYLQLRLRLSGNGRTTPRLRAVRLYYPRFSYLNNYLPAVYREDQDSASFLERFLANIEGFYTAIEDRIAAVQVLFDSNCAPAETLPWLASWFGIALDPAWNEYKQRLFIRHAMEFFQYRGTINGVKMALRLALEAQPGSHFLSGDATDQRCADRIRVIEKFRTRRTPGVLLGDPTEATGPRASGTASRWLPADGPDELNQSYRDFLAAAGQAVPTNTQFPLIEPSDAGLAALWREFAAAALGFVPSAASDDQQQWQEFLSEHYPDITTLNSEYDTSWGSFDEVPLPKDLPADGALRQDWTEFVLTSGELNAGTRQDMWQSFLARRYGSIANLNDSYATNWLSFAQVLVPRELPTNPSALQDWFQFESVALAMHQTAHKFVVLLPVSMSDVNNLAGRQAQLSLAQRLIELEKPAHTMFDVKFYWAMFRVGQARLEQDTQVGLGSRAPELLTPMVLNQGFLLESYLSPAPPRNTPGRLLIGTGRT